MPSNVATYARPLAIVRPLKWFHDVIGADEPLGWDHQLPNEPLVNAG